MTTSTSRHVYYVTSQYIFANHPLWKDFNTIIISAAKSAHFHRQAGNTRRKLGEAFLYFLKSKKKESRGQLKTLPIGI